MDRLVGLKLADERQSGSFDHEDPTNQRTQTKQATHESLRKPMMVRGNHHGAKGRLIQKIHATWSKHEASESP